MNVSRGVVASVALLASVSAQADGWDLFGKQVEMKNHVIADVGEVSQVEPPFNTKWREDVYQINGRCFFISGYAGYWGYGNKAGMLLFNVRKELKIALFETGIGSVKADLYSINLVDCPVGTNVIPYSDDPEERLRLLQRRQEELKKKLEELNKQK